MIQANMTVEPRLSPNAIRTLEARYLLKDPAGKLSETVAGMLRRVARCIAVTERAYSLHDDQLEHLAEQYYAMMASTQFLPNSPTLMNAGRSLGMLSACFVLPIDDSIEGIFESVKHTAMIQKAGGGTGFSFDRLRPTGDYIASSGGRTSGPISFWRVFSEATRAIQQGAFRRGANMGMMSIRHPDILKFVTAKSGPEEFDNFNISVKVGDDFMDALRRRPLEPHVVTNPHTGLRYVLPRALDIPGYTVRDLPPVDGPGGPGVYTHADMWNLIVRSAHATGEPGLCFIDRINAVNPTPHLGSIEATNPCGEQSLLDNEACNLGSIDVSKFVHGEVFDEAAFREVVRLAVRFLDDVIDASNYVTPEIRHICLGNRKIGLGIMGFADALFDLRLRYDSDEGLAFGRHIAQALTQEAFAASEDLARQRGNFPNFAGSRWDLQHRRPMRNAAVTCIAPTGTLSILAGCSGGIEPAYAMAFYRHILEGQEMLEVSAPFKRYAQEHGFWANDLALHLAGGAHLRDVGGIDAAAKDIFVTAHDVAPEMHVRMQAAFQEHIDGAISKTINLPQSAPVSDVDRIYHLAYDLGCKGVTVYRDNCRVGQPMLRTGEQATAGLCPRCRTDLSNESGCVRCPRCGNTLCS